MKTICRAEGTQVIGLKGSIRMELAVWASGNPGSTGTLIILKAFSSTSTIMKLSMKSLGGESQVYVGYLTSMSIPTSEI